MYKVILLMIVGSVIFSCNKKINDETIIKNSPMEDKEMTDKEIESKEKETINEVVDAKNEEGSEIVLSPFTNLELDIFGNKYIYSDIELIKLDSNNDTLAVFNTRNTSGISSVSVTNPNKLVVYSRDNQLTWTLDSTLSIIEEKRIDLPQLGEIGFVTRLEGDDVLYYSRSAKKFFRTNSNNNKVLESDVQWDMESEIRDIVESQDLFIVRNEENQVYLFDSFGNLIKEVKIKMNDGPVDFQNNYIYQIEGNQLRYLDLKDPTAEFKEYKLSAGLQNVSDFKMARQKIYTLSNGKVKEQKIMIVNY